LTAGDFHGHRSAHRSPPQDNVAGGNLKENRGKAKRMLSHMMDEFGLSLFGFLFGVSLLAIQANRTVPVPLNEPPFLVLLEAFLL